MTQSLESDLAWVPSSCTLPTAEQPLRSAEFDQVFAAHVRSVTEIDPTTIRVVLNPSPEVASTVADLASRETGCCAFFTFTLTIASEELALQVSAAPAHTDVLAALGARATRLSQTPA